MNASINLDGIAKSISKFFGRYHMLLFFVFVSAGLGYALLSVISIVSISNTDTPSSSATSTTFDQATMDRLKKLDTGTQNTSLQLPQNVRINPLVDN